jgi:hypothetical protein
MDSPIGLIAGQGRLPILTAQGMRAAGRHVACVGLRGQFEPELPALCDWFRPAGIVQLGRWIHLLRRWHVCEAVLVGRVRKTRMYEPFRLFRQLPDWRALRVWYRTLRHDKRTNALLTAVADELGNCGIKMVDLTPYIPHHMADPDVMTRVQPTASIQADIRFGLPILRRLGELDIGQAIAVGQERLAAVEAIEGTDPMIARAGALCTGGGWTLMKTARPNQDMRFDVPTVGLKTIENLKAAGAVCMAVEAGKVILLDKPQLLQAADKAGIVVMGLRL